MLLAGVFTLLLSTQSAVGKITVHVDGPGREISPTFFGLMTEEINHSYDGGLYGELVQNRALKDDSDKPAHWSLVKDEGSAATMLLDKDDPVPNTVLDRCIKLEIPAGSKGTVGVANEGYWGIPIWPNTNYRLSFFAKASRQLGNLHASLESGDGKSVLASMESSGIASEWRKYSLTFKTGDLQATKDAKLVLSTVGSGTLCLTQVSLFPPTFNNRPNGNRIDLMQKLIGMKPSFLRFPGGNFLEGNSFKERFDWKATLGPIEQRPGHWGPWGYRSTDGIGLLEFLEWCEDMKSQPVLAVFAGYTLGKDKVSSGPALEGFVQEALDEIEYVTGDATTKWGARRIGDGHAMPFALKYVEVGNEDWNGTQYDERFPAFYDAIRAKYPNLKIIATNEVKSRVPDLVDDHYYRKATLMMKDAGHYASADRNGHKTFVGEWASTDTPPWLGVSANPTPVFHEALGDAIWLTGLEQSADQVLLECYAPLLTNINPKATQWGVNLIGYDSLSSYGSPSYYVQSMFAHFTGNRSLPLQVESNVPALLEPVSKGAIGLGTWRTDAEYTDFKVTGPDGKTLSEQPAFSDLVGWKLGAGAWEAHEGALHQSSVTATDTMASIGNDDWTDYTIHVKARKLSGSEGFVIAFHYRGTDRYWKWTIGGWGNTRTVFQRVEDGYEEAGNVTSMSVETGRWYDLELQVIGDSLKGFIDGKLVTERPVATPTPTVFAAASRAGKDIFLKVVNASPTDADMVVDLVGAGKLGAEAEGLVMTGDPEDKNSIDQPLKVSPRPIRVSGVGRSFQHLFPAHSVTVLRLKSAK